MTGPTPGRVRCGAVVLTMGGRPVELKAALDSLLRQRDVDMDVVVVGNGWEPVDLPPGVAGVGLPENVGIPAGRNAGVGHVSGELLLFLDDDELIPDDGFVAEATRRFRDDPRLGMIQPRIDVLGEGEPPRRWVPRSRVGDRTRSSRAFYVMEGALVLRRDVFDAAGGWADPFWYAHEGTELAWRVWDTGHTVHYAGDMVAQHPLTAVTRHANSFRMNGRNRVLLARRNLPLPFGVAYVLSWAGLQLVRSVRDPATLLPYLQGMREGLTMSTSRRRLRWRTIARMTRYGRPPVW
ncbi:glycosyltransferase family 2 protein [Blastococcus tunisiensis]|uniref:Glycosyltransferase, GT2 family n=1 Tax=Blastococcus tunisiensis TaxID=1798228 RepID=A0A1I1X9S7_9ACTN|nr:glycosyltransferase [Blastococcus sp. DSM 46838]SFE04087.1 Glycosyltransferase, GT2 family [Blastococcus sp. DSM 46838]